MKSRLIHRSVRRGFTLIEAVATMTILAAIATVASNIILTSADGYLNASTSAQLHTEMSIGLDRLVREVRNINLDESAGDIAPDIDSVTASSVDWSGNNSVAFAGDELQITEDGGSAAILLTDVSSFNIQCFDEDNAALSTTLSGSGCDVIRRIELTISLQRHGVTETLRTKVFLRSTMQGAGAGS